MSTLDYVKLFCCSDYIFGLFSSDVMEYDKRMAIIKHPVWVFACRVQQKKKKKKLKEKASYDVTCFRSRAPLHKEGF